MPGMNRLGSLVSLLFVAAISSGCASSNPADQESAKLASIPGCGASNAGVIPPMVESGPLDGAAAPALPVTDEASLFAVQIEPSLQVCRTCHVAGGVADTDAGDLFSSTDGSSDHDACTPRGRRSARASTRTRSCTKGSNTDPDGALGRHAVAERRRHLRRREDPPLVLGRPRRLRAQLAHEQNARQRRAVIPSSAISPRPGAGTTPPRTAKAKPDCATLPPDPRELIAGENINNAELRRLLQRSVRDLRQRQAPRNPGRSRSDLVASRAAPAAVHGQAAAEERAASGARRSTTGGEYIVRLRSRGAV